ncbi:MAG: leucine--tRNA ligase [Candidatus Niyogibacteria bacterium]|nr:leucine--tRNA ligase [Candidatus Niyogibacteria bacterium]
MAEYNHKKIEKKWREAWERAGLYMTREDKTRPKSYVLDMFPYPSGEGLHVGHPKGYIATDIYSRFKQMNGYNILHPMGWDAFGLPAEQYALKNKIHPRLAVEKNTKRFKEQLSVLGLNYDWEREINTTDPEYYRWTQWAFLKMFERGLVFESLEPINWCPSCKTGLANEDLDGGACERCGTAVEKKPLRQLTIKITEYADRLLTDLEDLNWPESIKESQRNWIGRSEGAEIEFKIYDLRFKKDAGKFTVFTTRADTLFGATYCVLAPEHKLVEELKNKITNWDEVVAYVAAVKNKSEIERTVEGKEKTGVELAGVKAVNPANGAELPIFIADYVLAHYGTGAIMAVPAHDERDWEFAKKFGLPIKQVICQFYPEPKCPILEAAYTGGGKLVGSNKFNGLDVETARRQITEFVGGKITKKYKLRDWVFARQRYWGEPIPLVHCEKCGVVGVPESELPVLLPDVESYEPTGTGESPLAAIDSWVNTKCPKCGGPAKRETNTMPQWAGSSWYYLRYIDPKNSQALVDKTKEKYWSPVDMYVGGAEHATRHLIYARFWHKFLYDIGAVNYTEPFKRLQNVGLINAEDGRKMSKRYGNVVNPDLIVENYGADTLRVYEMFMGPFDQSVAWSTESIIGARRFLEKVWRLQEKVVEDASQDKKLTILLHQTVKKVGEDIEQFRFNTAISQMMVLVNAMEKADHLQITNYKLLIIILAPFAPLMCEEIFQTLRGAKDFAAASSVHNAEWPQFDASLMVEEEYELVVQINGKVRTRLTVLRAASEEEIRERVLSDEKIKEILAGAAPRKVIVVPGRIANIVL